MRIIKRNGSEEIFDVSKIERAILGANRDVNPEYRMPEDLAHTLSLEITSQIEAIGHTPTVEEVQDKVEQALMEEGYYLLARAYIVYRYQHEIIRHKNTTDEQILSLLDCNNELAKQENSNKNPIICSTQRDYMAGEVSKDVTKRFLLPEAVVKAHEDGLIHFHDSDYFSQHMHNCDLVNLDDMLQNGTVISETMIEKPHSFHTACNIATQIIAQVASSQYGGQSITLTHLAPFVNVSRLKIRRDVHDELAGTGISEDKMEEIVNKRLAEEVARGIQTIQYQLITLMTTNGQAPFLSVFLWPNEVDVCWPGGTGPDGEPNEQIKEDLVMMIHEVLKQRYQGVKNEVGAWITPAFPKLLYVLDEDNTPKGSKWRWLTEEAAKCTARRMVPDYISAKIMRQYKLSRGEMPGDGDVYPCMGCRSFLTPDRSGNGFGNIAHAKNYQPDQPKYYGRFNQGVVTINLPYVALESKRDEKRFWEFFDETLEICHTALRARHERLLGTYSDAAPILWQHGALARLGKGETIDRLLYDGYSTISLGYAGLHECVKYMTGVSHTDPAGHPFAVAVMQHLNDACTKWKEAENIDYSVYGTPMESTTYKFAKALQKKFGIIDGVSDHQYITNSYHVCVREEIDAFSKLGFEAEFQQLSPGGAISYIEVPDMQDNLEAVVSVLEFIYDNIMYAELNTKSDYCQKCGYDGEIQIVEDDGKLVWECPNCGNRDQDTMNVARRTCGYIGTQYWNQGRTREIQERTLHL